MYSNRKVKKENNFMCKFNRLNQLTLTAVNNVATGPHKKPVHPTKQDPKLKASLNICKGFRTQSCQTDIKAINEYDGVIRYPSSSSRWQETKTHTDISVQVKPSPEDVVGQLRSCRTCTPQIHLVNKINQVAFLKPKTLPKQKVDPCKAPSTYKKGVVPKYLYKLKEENGLEKMPILRSKDMEECDAEKKEKLKRIASWHNSYKEMVSELNMLSDVC